MPEIIVIIIIIIIMDIVGPESWSSMSESSRSRSVAPNAYVDTWTEYTWTRGRSTRGHVGGVHVDTWAHDEYTWTRGHVDGVHVDTWAQDEYTWTHTPHMPLTHHSHAGSRYVADAAGVRTLRHALETSWGVCAIDIFSCSGSLSRTNCDTCAPFSPWPSKTPKRAVCEGDWREIGGRSAGDRREIGIGASDGAGGARRTLPSSPNLGNSKYESWLVLPRSSG